MENSFIIRKLSPELAEDYFHFLITWPFSDNLPMQPCC